MFAAKSHAYRSVFRRRPIRQDEFCSTFAGDPGDDVVRLRRHGTHDHRDARFDDAGFLTGDIRERVAEVLLMIEVDRRDGGHDGLNDIGRVEPSAQANLDDAELDAGVTKQVERHRRRRFEEGRLSRERVLRDHRLDRGLHVGRRLPHLGGADRLSVDDKSFRQVDEMRRGVASGVVTRAPQHLVDHRGHGSLAVCTGDVNRSKSVLGIAETREQRANVVEAELDAELFEAEKVGERIQTSARRLQA